jgi:IclR family transcriptional regulator, KDG regulon repressor
VEKENVFSDPRNDESLEQGEPTGSIAHATDVLLCISDDVHALTDIARQCNLGKSTVHRVLKLLEQSRLVVQDVMNRRYYLGPLITRLAANPLTTHEYLVMYSSDEMKRISRISEETVTLDILIGLRHFPFYEIPSPHDLKVTQESRMTGPWYAGASIKVLLSVLTDKQLKIALDDAEYPVSAERVEAVKQQLAEQINTIRRQGYFISYGERVPGATCISVPIKNYTLPVVLSIVGPESRIKPREKEAVAELKASAARISANFARLFHKEVS